MSAPRYVVRTTLVLVLLLLAGASRAAAGVTSLLLNSEPGDYIGQGQLLVFTDADGAFLATSGGGGNVVNISFNTPTFNHWWYVNFGAPNTEPLAVGSYDGAARSPFRGPGQPGLEVTGDGRGCNTLTGRFTVLELVLGGAGEVVSFRASFEQHCEGATPALRGEVRYNANVPLQLTGPSFVTALENQLASFEVTAVAQGGGQVSLSPSNLPLGASFVDNNNNTGTFSWTPLTSQAGTYVIAVQGTSGVFVETIYVRITVILTPPPNDEVDSAVSVTGIPFTYVQQTATATSAPDDPFCYGSKGSVWFVYTPVITGRVEFNTIGSDYDTTLSAYTGTHGNLSQLACNWNGSQSRIRFDATAGTTYYLMVGAPFWGTPGSLTLHALEAPPPFTMQITLNPFNLVDPSTGGVLVNGTAICSAPSFVFLSGSIRQVRAGHEIRGFFSASVPCDGATPWEAAVYHFSNDLFHGRGAALFNAGSADVALSASAYDPIEGTYVYRNAAATVRLRGGR
jgi:hypothetical protein